jgi:hypothetical protein
MSTTENNVAVRRIWRGNHSLNLEQITKVGGRAVRLRIDADLHSGSSDARAQIQAFDPDALEWKVLYRLPRGAMVAASGFSWADRGVYDEDAGGYPGEGRVVGPDGETFSISDLPLNRDLSDDELPASVQQAFNADETRLIDIAAFLLT